MTEYQLVKAMLLHLSNGLDEDAPLAKALKKWMLDNLAWMDINVKKKKAKKWDVLFLAIQKWRLPELPTPYVMELTDSLASTLEMNEQDHLLLTLLIGCDRMPKVRSLCNVVMDQNIDLPTFLGELCGVESHDTLRFVRCSPVMRLGLIELQSDRFGSVDIDIKWTLEKLLDRAPALGDAFLDALIGPRQKTNLTMQDFTEVEAAPFLARLLSGAVKENAKGINILLHGPPGTGKTELAKVLCDAADLRLHAVGEVDEDGDEPDRYERLCALMLGQKVLNEKKEAVILFDEMEDFIGTTRRGSGDVMLGRSGSKVFANRMLENNKVPVIWTTNAIKNVDDAIIRRMSFVLELDYPSRNAAHKIVERICKDEKVDCTQELKNLVDSTAEASTVVRTAARAAKLTGYANSIHTPAIALVETLRGGSLPIDYDHKIDLKLYNSEPPLEQLIEGIASNSYRDVSLLLSGPPGTGKTALAQYFARRLNKPLLAKRSSDLLSKWVGETEKNIADAFTEARKEKSVLFFDEADSLMFDRSSASKNWEVGQVNELLSWLDRHDQPVLAATNHAKKLDPATLRRFDFKIELKTLDEMGLKHAFHTFFGMEAPVDIVCIDNLTPGDFAVVKKQIRFQKNISATSILRALEREAELKPCNGLKMGFGR